MEHKPNPYRDATSPQLHRLCGEVIGELEVARTRTPAERMPDGPAKRWDLQMQYVASHSDEYLADALAALQALEDRGGRDARERNLLEAPWIEFASFAVSIVHAGTAWPAVSFDGDSR